MSNTVTGTFSGTGISAEIVGRLVNVFMDFAGTASVDIEVRIGSSWIKKTTAITADSATTMGPWAAPVAHRLNCTAHTNNVVYVLQTGPDG